VSKKEDAALGSMSLWESEGHTQADRKEANSVSL